MLSCFISDVFVLDNDRPGFLPSKPMPILHIHSVDDPCAPYYGGEGKPFPGTKTTISHPSVDEVLMQWATYNGCQFSANRVTVKDASNSIGHKATLYNYGPGANGTPLFHWQITGRVGHAWPSKIPEKRTFITEKTCGDPTDVIDANKEMWEFFSMFL